MIQQWTTIMIQQWTQIHLKWYIGVMVYKEQNETY